MSFTEIRDALRNGSVLRNFLSQEGSIVSLVYYNNSVRACEHSFDSVLDSMIFAEDYLTISNRRLQRGLTRESIESRESPLLGDFNILELNKMRPDLWVKKGGVIECSYQNKTFIAQLFKPSKRKQELNSGAIYSNNNRMYCVQSAEGSHPWESISNVCEVLKNKWETYVFRDFEVEEQVIPEVSHTTRVQPGEIFLDEGFHRNYYRFRCNPQEASSF